MTPDLDRPKPEPVDPQVLQRALSAALGSFEMFLFWNGRTDLDYFDRLAALDEALGELEKHLDKTLPHLQ